VADDIGQAREDLVRDWSTERRPTWAIDTGLPGPGTLDRAALTALPAEDRVRLVAVAGGQARLQADAARAALPPDPAAELEAATAALVQLRQARADLEAGAGTYDQTEAGQAASDLRHALGELRSTEQVAQGSPSWRDRHRASRRLPILGEAANDAQSHWDAVVAPELARLDGEVAKAEAAVQQLTAVVQRHRTTSGHLARRWLEAERTSGTLSRRLDTHRDQIDGVTRPAPTATAAEAPVILPGSSPAYGPVTGTDLGPSL